MKGDLEDILTALGLMLTSLTLKKDDLLKAITCHFDGNPALCDSPCYIGLFTHTQGQKQSAPDENNEPVNHQPAATRQCHTQAPAPIFNPPV